jgi:intracellular multiplication protein IcmB
MARKIYHYSDIAGMSADDGPDAEYPCFYAHDGATCTLLRVRGTPSFIPEDEGIERSARILSQISSSMRQKGRGLTITYERSYNIDDEVARLTEPLADAALRKGMSLQAAVNETAGILANAITKERILVAVWTYRDAADSAAYREDKRRRQSTTGRLLLSRGIQDPNGPYESLQANHRGFVKQIMAAMTGQGFWVEQLGPNDGGREDLAEVRRALLYHETPANWSPKPAGPVRYPRAKSGVSADVSNLFAETLDRQIMTSAATASNDLRTITMGGRNYAIMRLSAMPQRMISFRSLLRNIDGATRSDDMPFRIAIHLESGAKIPAIKHTLATIGSLFDNANRLIKQSFDGILAEMRNDTQTYSYTRIFATTWTEPHEDIALLSERRSRLARALNSWQSPTVTDSAPDPMRLLVETCSGMVATARTGLPFIAPAREMGYAMPFHSDAPVEQEGETIYTTLDGKPMPFKAHSPMQDSWFGLIYANPGSGKSVLLNSLNMDFAAYYPSSLTPFIGILDCGESAFGFIESLQASLPIERRNECACVSLRNEHGTRQYTTNPFDTFFHLGVFDHGSDWVQDYAAAEDDVLATGIAGATASQFQVNFATTAGAGAAGVAEAFVIYRPTGQILWALVDGAGQGQINLQIGGQVFDLLA